MWKTNDALLEKAIRHFDLRMPVYVRRTNGNRRRGCYHGLFIGSEINRTLPNTLHHKITVSNRLTPTEASEVLWHELTHAAQRERDPLASVRYRQITPRSARGRRAYADYLANPYEVEARASESLHRSIGTLAT